MPVTPPGHYTPKHTAVINHTPLMSDMDAAFHTEAGRIQLRDHVAPSGDKEAPGMMFYGTAEKLKADEAALLAYVTDDGNADSAGYHAMLADLVYGLVDVQQSRRPSVTLSHEGNEMYGNARLNRVVRGPKDRLYYVELNDPVQRQTYRIRVTLFGESRDVEVSDFVYPAWFGMQNPDASSKRTHMDQPVQPFEIAPGGYQIAQENDGQIVFLSKAGEFAARHSKHSRTSRILQGCDKIRRARQNAIPRWSR